MLLFMLALSAWAQVTLPPANQKVVLFVKNNLNKKVLRGECWDLAKEALNFAGAQWDGMYQFGRQLDIKAEKVLSGDIVQFNGVKMEHREGTSISRWTMEKHTAIVYEVKDADQIILAEQNMNQVRKVTLNGYRISEVIKGKLIFYRPVL